MNGKWKDRQDAGSCNFCSDVYSEKYRKVFEFSGEGNGTLMVRICRKCLEKLNKMSKVK